MALALTCIGSPEAGAGTITGLATATPQTIYPYPAAITQPNGVVLQPNSAGMVTVRERPGYYIAMNVVSDNPFKLDYQFTSDGGTTWSIGNQVASATVTVDGGAAGFVNNAQLNFPVGYQWRVQVYQTSGGNAAFNYEWRYY